jgi:hypothetical protein
MWLSTAGTYDWEDTVGFDLAVLTIQPDSRFPFPNSYLGTYYAPDSIFSEGLGTSPSLNMVAYHSDSYPYSKIEKGCHVRDISHIIMIIKYHMTAMRWLDPQVRGCLMMSIE